MSKEILLAQVSKFLSTEDMISFNSKVQDVSDTEISLTLNKLKNLNLKDPVIAIVLEIVLTGICAGRIYIGDFKFILKCIIIFLVWFLILIVSAKLGFKLFVDLMIIAILPLGIGVWCWDIFTIMKKTRVDNYEKIKSIMGGKFSSSIGGKMKTPSKSAIASNKDADIWGSKR